MLFRSVQFYIRDRVASVTRPIRQLVAFDKVALAPGQTKTISFRLERSMLEFYGQDDKPVTEPGEFDLWIAPSAQAEGASGKIRLTA